MLTPRVSGCIADLGACGWLLEGRTWFRSRIGDGDPHGQSDCGRQSKGEAHDRNDQHV